MIRARFRMEVPSKTWVGELSRQFPSLTFRLLTGVPLGDRALELGEVLGPESADAASAIRNHPDITAYHEVYTGPDRAIARYESTDRTLYDFLGGVATPPEFPLDIEDGTLEFGLTATREQFDAVRETLRSAPLGVELVAVVHGVGRDVTDRQMSVLGAAFRMGYFDVPRRCRLADVAAEVGVDKSTASETIRRAERRIIEWFLLNED